MAKKRGGQEGNNNAGKGRIATQALGVALSKGGESEAVSSSIKTLVQIWNAQIALAKEGNPQAAAMIIDRLEGKPGQSLMLQGDEDNPLVIQKVVREIVDANNTNS